MSSSVGGVMSIVMFFSSTASLPLNMPQRGIARGDAKHGGSFLDAGHLRQSATAIFFSRTGLSNCSDARLCSVPPWDSVAVTDLRPVPLSVIWISSGATPSTSTLGETVICGGSDSKRGRR